MAKRNRVNRLVIVEFPNSALFRTFKRAAFFKDTARPTTGGYIEVLDAVRFRQILDACEGTIIDERIEEFVPQGWSAAG